MNLANKVLIGLGLGIAVGGVLNYLGSNGIMSADWINTYLFNGVFHVIGKLFFNALKMLVVPLVLFSLIPSIVGIGDIRLLGRVGTKTFALYIFTTAIAVTSAILIAELLGVGKGVELNIAATFEGKEAAKSFTDILIGIVPSNIVSALANSDMLAIIFFAIFFGIAALSILDEVKQLVSFTEQVNKVIMRMVEIVMLFAPYAVFCLVAKAIGELGIELVTQLARYFFVLLGILILHMLVTQMTMFKLLTRLSIKQLLSKMRATQLFAFGTSSSGATIPVTLRTVQQRLGVDRAISSFSIPFGATINMDGSAIMQGVATVFVANLMGFELGLSGYFVVVLTAILASIGTAAVPSVGLVMLTIIFDQVGLPVEPIGILLGVDRLLDMTRTAVNVTGDAVVTCIVAKSEGKLDEAVFNDPKAGEYDVHEIEDEIIHPQT